VTGTIAGRPDWAGLHKESDMTEINDTLNQWLRDAHAMEQQAEKLLESQAARIENYPQLSARIRQHLEETRSQRASLEQCLERRGESTSLMKDMTAKLTAMAQGLGGMMAGDEVMKGTLASYAFEHFEIGSYRLLVAAAEAAGDMETKRVCEEICRQEEAMAAWLADHVPEITRTYLLREHAELAEAKR
jgi:ferritin-like metal-binding protein YciE